LTGQLFCGDGPKKTIAVAVPVVFREQRVWNSLRSWLANKYGLQAAGVEFEKDFAALSKVTAHYEVLPLDQARLVLEAERQRSGERIQLVGLNLPLNTLSGTTVVILLAIQLYFWLHLRQFQPSDKDAAIAWVGLYDNVYARLITLATAVVLPVYTTLFVLNTHFFWLNLIAVIVSALLAFWSGRLLWQLPTHVRLRYVPIQIAAKAQRERRNFGR
jgi:hypothetical protein